MIDYKFEILNARFKNIYYYLKHQEIIESRKKFAKDINITGLYLSKILNGRSSIKIGIIYSLIKKYGINPNYLFTGEGRILSEKTFDLYYSDTKLKNKFEIPIPVQIRTPIKQYLIYFNEYARIAHNIKTSLEVEDYDNGLIVKFSENTKIEIIEALLDRYLGLIKEKIEDLDSTIETNISDSKREIFILELKSQIRFFKNSLEIKAVEIRYLNDTLKYFKTLLLTEKENPKTIVINTQSISHSNSSNNISIDNYIEIPPQNFDNAMNTLMKMKENLLEDKTIDLKFKTDVFELFIELEKEIRQGKVNKNLLDKILEKSSKISTIGTFLINLMRILG